ncbi:MAG: hypothetical protein COA78_36145, partial [Blastopirellula sp.]
MSDTELDIVDAIAAPENKQVANKKKRSPIERAIVWGAISVFLIVLLVEVNARYGYSKTLAEMQNRIQLQDEGKDFTLADAKEIVKGFPYGEERLTNSGKEVQYRWLSLFRTFAIKLNVDNDDQIQSLETDADPFGDEKVQANLSKPYVPKIINPDKGLGEEFENVVVLTTEPLESTHSDAKGSLAREIVRQAMLIGGREGLGQETRDTSLRGDVQLIENP